MKFRILTAILAVTLSLSLLTSCGPKGSSSGSDSSGGSASSVQPGSGTISPDLAVFYQTLTQNYEWQAAMDKLPGDFLTNYYAGLESIATNQEAIYASMISLSNHEIALIEVQDSGDVGAVKTILQTRVDDQVNGGAWYPSSIEEWENNSRVESSGNFVILVVHPDADAIVSDFLALVG